MKRTGTIFDVLDDKPKNGKEGFFQAAINTPEPNYVKEKSETREYKPSFFELDPFSSELTKEDVEAMSPAATGLMKGIASGATLGATEHAEALKPTEEEESFGAFSTGQFIGSIVPLSGLAKAVSIPFKMSGLMNYGAGRIASSATTGAAVSTIKQAIKGEGISPGEVALEAGLFGGLHTIFELPNAARWLNSLRPSQKAKLLTDGLIPKDLNPNQYKFYEEEIVPEIQKAAENTYKEEFQKAFQENEREFSSKMNKVKAKHEDDLFKISQEKKLSQEEFEAAQVKYQNELKQVAAEHEAQVAEIEKQNKLAQDKFQNDRKDFEEMKVRQQLVQDAIKPKQSDLELRGRIKPEGEDVGFRPAPGIEKEPSLRNKVGSIFSENVVKNESAAGLENVKAIKANDNIDYQKVREAYEKSDQLSEMVATEHSGLALEMTRLIDELNQIPELSPPRKQLLTIAQKILGKIGIFNEEGVLVGFNKVSNKVIQDQAKELRYFMDFNFEHGNTRGIFSPLVNTLEDAAELASTVTNNTEAYEASKNARRLYKQWAQDYDNDYIRPFRDTKNRDYIKLFNQTLDPDAYPVIDAILSRSNAGQQLSSANKRALVEKELKPFFENRGKAHAEKFEDALKRLRGIITPEEEKSLHEIFASERRTPVIKGKKIELPEIPKEPKLKELPRARIPLLGVKPKEVKEITEVKIPLKPQVKETPSMKAASKLMDITPEKAIKLSNTPTGLKEIKKNVPKKLFEKIAKDKIKQILYKGKVRHKFTGNELYDIINEGDNFAMFSEILGEEQATDLLITSKEIGKTYVNANALKKHLKHYAFLKMFLHMGIL